MNHLKLYSEKHIEKLISVRLGETKLGQKLQFVKDLEFLKNTEARFVIIGIPEDIGVRANYGQAGTASAWEAFLKAFLNVQENDYNSGEQIILLGEINTSEVMKKAGNIDVSDLNYIQKLGDLVGQLDAMVSGIVKKVILAGKFPIIIGGGHNNAFGNIKGAAEAYQNPVNVMNIDAHTDLRQTGHRHSGNGFSYALKNGFLQKYSVFGLHKNYTPKYIFEQMNASEVVEYRLLEELPKQNRTVEFQNALEFVKAGRFGLELDCDAIADFPSSAISPSGFSLEEAGTFLAAAAKEKNCCYLHICEAIATGHFPTGKALSYFVTDFIRQKTYAGNI